MYSEGYADYSRLPALPWMDAAGSAKGAVDGGNSVYQRESHSSCCINIWKTGYNYHYLMHSINLIVSN